MPNKKTPKGPGGVGPKKAITANRRRALEIIAKHTPTSRGFGGLMWPGRGARSRQAGSYLALMEFDGQIERDFSGHSYWILTKAGAQLVARSITHQSKLERTSQQ